MAEGSETVNTDGTQHADLKTWELVNKFILLLNTEKPDQEQGLDAVCLMMATVGIAYGVDSESVITNFKSAVEAIQDLKKKGHAVAEIYDPTNEEHVRAARINRREAFFNQPDVSIYRAIVKAFEIEAS